MQTPKKFLLALTILLLPAAVWAAPKVDIAITAEKDVIVTENGQKVAKRVPAAEAAPGEIIIYTLDVANTGDEAATNVMVNDPIPAGTAYVPGSASEVGDVTFSIDGGKSYKKPSLLTYEVTNPTGTKEKRVASPEQYTNVRWELPQLPAGANQQLRFQVKVK